jgi:Kef-type K+ transport system membrane component KefB
VDTIFEVFVVFVAATVASEAIRPLRQPAIVAELLVGIALGPHAVGWIHIDDATSTLAALGIVVLMFTVGLELRVTEIRTVGRSALGASIAGVVVTTATAVAVLAAFRYPSSEAVRAGVALAATSAGIGARLLVDFDRVKTRPARVLLGAAVLDDVIVLLAFSVVLTHGSALSVALSVATAVAFIGLVASLGPWLARRHGSLLGSDHLRQPPYVFALVICLGLAALAERAGLAALIGAFLAGMVLAETKDELSLVETMHPIYAFFVPFFFVIAGARVDPSALREVGIVLAAVLIVVTIAAKWAGGALGALSLGRRERLFVGAGMIPRGEVTVAAASTALAVHSIDRSVYALLLSAVFVTTVVTPFLLRPFARGPSA